MSDNLIKKFLGHHLHIANTNGRSLNHTPFYDLKNRILLTYGEYLGFDIQHVRKECWTCFGDGCWRCLHTGVYREFWTKLPKYKLGDYTFHIPVEKFLHRPDGLYEHCDNAIEGYVKHSTDISYKKSWISFMTLCIFFNHTYFFRNQNPKVYFNAVKSVYSTWKARREINKYLRELEDVELDPDDIPF